jgi:hypothetical protein
MMLTSTRLVPLIKSLPLVSRIHRREYGYKIGNGLKRTTSAKTSHIRGQLVGEIVEFNPENENQKTYAKVISKNAGSCVCQSDTID